LVSTYMDEAALCDRIALKKRNRFKDWYAYKYHFKLIKRFMMFTEYPSINSGFKKYLANTVCMPLGSTFIISIKM
jgi:hypothetical protein